MKISKRLKLNSWIYMVAVMLMMLALAWAFWSFDKSNRNLKLTEEMQKAAFERIALRDDYLLNRGERASIQWHAKSETLRRLIETAAERLTDKEEKALLQKARHDFDATFAGFSAALEKDKREWRKANRIFSFDEKTARDLGQIFLKSYMLMDSIGSLHQSATRAVLWARNILVFMIIFFFVFGGLVIVINSNLLNRLLIQRLNGLTTGVNNIGDGHLDYHIPEEGDDELADLARSSNKMAVNLKQSHTSIENLQREISERKQAEEDLKRIEQRYALLLMNLETGIIVHAPDTSIIMNNIRALEILGLSDDQIKGKRAIDPAWNFVNADNTPLPLDDYPVNRIITSQKPIRKQLLGILKPGKNDIVWVMANGFPVLDVTGNITEIVISIVDITGRIQAEFQREDALEEIKKLNAELEQRVAERTVELSTRTTELEKVNKIFVDRELRVIELKARIAELEKKEK